MSMHEDDPTNRDVSPIDDEGRVPVTDAEGWYYLSFERDDATGDHKITLQREEDGEKVSFTLPHFVEQGDELSEITQLVIRARERWRELKGLGG
jgi:hypothetical protein